MRLWEKYKKMTVCVMDPSSKVWLKLDNTRKSDVAPLSLDEILNLAEQNRLFT